MGIGGFGIGKGAEDPNPSTDNHRTNTLANIHDIICTNNFCFKIYF